MRVLEEGKDAVLNSGHGMSHRKDKPEQRLEGCDVRRYAYIWWKLILGRRSN